MVPVLRLTHHATGSSVELSVNNLEPLSNTHLLRAYTSWDPRVQALGVKVKRWAKELGVTGAMEGYLSPYTLVLLVLFFLQVGDFGLPSLQVCLEGPLRVGWRSKEGAGTTTAPQLSTCQRLLGHMCVPALLVWHGVILQPLGQRRAFYRFKEGWILQEGRPHPPLW